MLLPDRSSPAPTPVIQSLIAARARDTTQRALQHRKQPVARSEPLIPRGMCPIYARLLALEGIALVSSSLPEYGDEFAVLTLPRKMLATRQ